MNRKELKQLIADNYDVESDCPWNKYPNFEVFRHRGSRKWFALIMDIPKDKLDLSGEGLIDVVNFKCDPILAGVLRQEAGFFPAYHMNKKNWITAVLDGSASDERIEMLLEESYNATKDK